MRAVQTEAVAHTVLAVSVVQSPGREGTLWAEGRKRRSVVDCCTRTDILTASEMGGAFHSVTACNGKRDLSWRMREIWLPTYVSFVSQVHCSEFEVDHWCKGIIGVQTHLRLVTVEGRGRVWVSQEH